MHLVLEMTVQPLHDQVRGSVHIQQEPIAIRDFTHIPFGPYGNPMSAGFVVRILVDDVSGWSFLGWGPGKTFPWNRSVKDTGKFRMTSCQMVQL